MHVLLRCDAGGASGFGHLVRCLALAEEAVARGHRVSVEGDIAGDLALAQVAAAGARRGPAPEADVVHTDSYRPDWAYPDGVLRSCAADGPFGRRPADLLVDQTLGAQDEPAPPGGVALLGSRYVALRRRVLAHRDPARRPAAQVRSVLVVLGGTDPLGLAPAVSRLVRRAAPSARIAVVANARTRAELEQLPGPVRVLDPVADLAAVMIEHDLVVSAAGTATWELACLRVPMLLVRAVANQAAGYQRMLDRGAALGLGTAADLDSAAALEAVRRAVSDAQLRRSMVERAAALVDGLGSWRVVGAWEALLQAHARRPDPPRLTAPPTGRLTARPATAADAELLWRWRNDPGTRAMSRQRGEVQLADHLAWLRDSLGRPDRLLLVVEDGGSPVGTVRWDRLAGQGWQVSITVDPGRRGQGLGAAVLAAGEVALRAKDPTGPRLAGVHETNEASYRLFLRAGYLPDLPPDRDGFRRLRKS
ncbi:MAG TPA: bifunctional UDP-2,4-diacetamido-2,4,6-trideoxy-beta-L-altropyranose hydrolase/GNAT family N-acetyltransferase [Dermatophilaceae bacterium]|nr:bifunctional UDP-2,4-diacetamido-2,4,6-trideoxy-beta-L-altropyranose hydrolase/GNAT family N-acetyltransferase [Dermatophilaceae bacterium]